MAVAAEKFARCPSRMVGLDDPVLALDFDLAAAARLIEREHATLASSADAEGAAEFAGGGPAREERW